MPIRKVLVPMLHWAVRFEDVRPGPFFFADTGVYGFKSTYHHDRAEGEEHQRPMAYNITGEFIHPAPDDPVMPVDVEDQALCDCESYDG